MKIGTYTFSWITQHDLLLTTSILMAPLITMTFWPGNGRQMKPLIWEQKRNSMPSLQRWSPEKISPAMPLWCLQLSKHQTSRCEMRLPAIPIHGGLITRSTHYRIAFYSTPQTLPSARSLQQTSTRQVLSFGITAKEIQMQTAT